MSTRVLSCLQCSMPRYFRTACYFIWGLGVLFFASVAMMSVSFPAFAMVRLEAPESVNPGQPFVVTLVADEPLVSVRLEWRGYKFVLPVEELEAETGKGYRAQALLGVSLSEKSDTLPLRVRVSFSGKEQASVRSLKVRPKDYPEQRLNVKKNYVDLSKSDLARYRKERKEVNGALNALTAERHWLLPLRRPVPGEVSSAFGLRRIFNGQPRKPHSGIDMRGAQGTPIAACADGVVVLKVDHFFTGNSVYIDHGEGVVSMYFHMSQVDVVAGQKVKKGQTIGAVGSTGRVTGPHLHFGLSLQGTAEDPTSLFE